MIITLDNHKLRKYDKVWEIGVTIYGIYVPTLSIYGSSKNPLSNEERCWKSYELCLAECDRKNSLNNQ